MTGTRAIEPLDAPPDAVVTLPGSKSITNRALVCAALATGTSRLSGILLADDTHAMLDGLRALGAGIDVVDGPDAVVRGTGGDLREGPVTVDARLSGTTSRFLMAVAGLATGPVTVDGGAPLRERPMADGFAALATAGVGVEGSEGHLPVTLRGGMDWSGRLEVAGDVSSQFLSGLLLAAPVLRSGLELTVSGELQSGPYVTMTVEVMRAFGAEVEVDADLRRFAVAPTGYAATDYVIEPDASAASYFFAAAAVCGGRVRVDGLGRSSLQGDVRFVDVLARMGAEVEIGESSIEVTGPEQLEGVEVDMAEISDTAQTLGAIAPFAEGPTTVSGIGFIRAKETDRIAAVVTELDRLGVSAEELPDGFRVQPGPVLSGVVQTYDDHRMAMSFAVCGLRVPGVVIADPDVVTKTFPDFFERLDQLRSVDTEGAGRGVVAIDGPAGSGKSTVARLVSDRLGIPYLDTGAMYRAVTWAAQHAGVDVADADAVSAVSRDMVLELTTERVLVDGIDVTAAIRGPEVTGAVSVVAAHSGVRTEMRRRQRVWMKAHGGGVVEGRDIGTVVFPDAAVKVFLNASPLARARRRATERNEMDEADVQRVAEELARRDHLDSTRDDSPLHEAADALVVDTTDLSVDQVVGIVVERYHREVGDAQRSR